MNVLFGLGCSWTQGEGGYPEEIWKEYNGKINLPMHKSYHLIEHEHRNSWVNVLCRDYLSEYIPYNLGQRGIGNRGSARSLYLTNIDFSKVENGIVVFMMSGYERFDFFRDSWKNTKICYKSDTKDAGHYNFQTVWPHLGNSKLWDIYTRQVYAEDATAIETLCNILEVQTFCKANNLKFVLANAFDDRGKDFLYEHCDKLANKVDWSCYIHNFRDYKTFVELLVRKDNWLSDEMQPQYYNHYSNLDYPKKHLTNCIHPNVDGYKVIAEELANFIKEKYPNA
jgi:hypothetical protein